MRSARFALPKRTSRSISFSASIPTKICACVSFPRGFFRMSYSIATTVDSIIDVSKMRPIKACTAGGRSDGGGPGRAASGAATASPSASSAMALAPWSISTISYLWGAFSKGAPARISLKLFRVLSLNFFSKWALADSTGTTPSKPRFPPGSRIDCERGIPTRPHRVHTSECDGLASDTSSWILKNLFALRPMSDWLSITSHGLPSASACTWKPAPKSST
mmetsp:Transcript_20652/g.61700  ORF Transcript_20652/g.61700 Transcript_20652/m.61700 type:complete len:220 (-) Transcript_20652:123-782(-)